MKRGRPRKDKPEKNGVGRSIYLGLAQHDWLVELAKDKSSSVSAIVRGLLDEAQRRYVAAKEAHRVLG